MELTQEQIKDYEKAGEIAKQVKEFAKQIIKPGMPLLEIAEKIDDKIKELGGEPAFPINLCINEIAAHYTPSTTDETKAEGLLKVDIGVHINGYIADTAFSLDLTPDQQHKQIIQANEQALKNALDKIKLNIPLTEIGREIQETITSSSEKFSPIKNLSGHELGKHIIHAGLTIPNYENNNQTPLPPGAYAVEPFATTGIGVIQDSAPSGIYRIKNQGGVRNPTAREFYKHLLEKYKTLPFCERWLAKKFKNKTRIALHFLEQAGIIHQYPQLVEKSKAPVSQAENTIIITKNKKEVTTD